MIDVIFPELPKPKEFECLKLGDLFLDPKIPDSIYIRINQLEKGEKTAVNAVNLQSGRSYYFEHDDLIHPVGGRLRLHFIEEPDFGF